MGLGRAAFSAHKVLNIGRASFGTAATAGSGRIEALCASARTQLDTLYKEDWTTVEEEDVTGLDSILAQFRPLYESASSQQQEVMAETYAARHASVMTALFAEHVRWTTRLSLYAGGWLGESRKLKKDVVDDALQALEDYPKFVESIEPDRVRRKVESELGAKMVQLRQSIQVPEFSSKFSAVATDHIVTRDY